MTENIAELHGFSGGVIVHDDLQPDQWLISPEGRIILNEVNNAQPLRYNFENGEYCPFYKDYYGDYRAPEEYYERPKDERTDMFVLGS